MSGAEGRSAVGVRGREVVPPAASGHPAGHVGESRKPQGVGVIMEEDRSLSPDRASGLRDLQGIGTGHSGLYIYVMPFP